jgi:hypothetical protein
MARLRVNKLYVMTVFGVVSALGVHSARVEVLQAGAGLNVTHVPDFLDGFRLAALLDWEVQCHGSNGSLYDRLQRAGGSVI